VSTIRAAEAARRFDATAKLPPLLLVFGPDRGLVREVADGIARLFPADDPFAVVRLDGATVADDPARLADEAYTVPLFGGLRLVSVGDPGQRDIAGALAPLVERPPEDAVVLLEAGALRKTAPLRKLVDGSRAAVAIECNADSERDLERVVDEEAARLGLHVNPDARAALVSRLGADRAASRSDILKACLHAEGTLTLADVDAVVGDSAVTEMGDAVAAAFLGETAALDRLLARVLRENSAAVTLLMTAQWTVQSLENGSLAVAAGASSDRAAAGMRPPMWTSARPHAPRILDRWSPTRLRAAAELIAAGLFRTRVMPALAAEVARDTLFRIAAEASRKG
jgi:DNA polymerase-3 subunit delta